MVKILKNPSSRHSISNRPCRCELRPRRLEFTSTGPVPEAARDARRAFPDGTALVRDGTGGRRRLACGCRERRGEGWRPCGRGRPHERAPLLGLGRWRPCGRGRRKWRPCGPEGRRFGRQVPKGRHSRRAPFAFPQVRGLSEGRSQAKVAPFREVGPTTAPLRSRRAPLSPIACRAPGPGAEDEPAQASRPRRA